jgi:hypothetical protein
MGKRTRTGEERTRENETDRPDSVPEISHFKRLDATEQSVAYAILEKLPGDSWESVAKHLKLSRRQLFNLRQRPKIQDAVCAVSREMLKGDASDVFKALTAKAKSGDTAAMRLFFELLGEFKEKPPKSMEQMIADFWQDINEFNPRPASVPESIQ